MADLLAWIAAFFFGSILVTTLLVVATVWGLRRSNRVDPRIPTHAPLYWLWSLGWCARLHRRLRFAVRNARLMATAGAEAVVADLAAYACALDHRVVAVARTPWLMRLEQLPWLTAEVHHVEHLAARLCGFPGALIPVMPVRGLRDLDDRVDALDAARREVAAVEARTLRYTPL
jgi:hypothetical protein